MFYFYLSTPLQLFGRVTESAENLLRIILKVNRHWQENNSPASTFFFWDNAAYHTGNMEVYELTGNTAYLEIFHRLGEYGGKAASDNKAEWRYGYGETPQYVLFGDWQCCFQTYADLYGIQGDDRRIARAREVRDIKMQHDVVQGGVLIDDKGSAAGSAGGFQQGCRPVGAPDGRIAPGHGMLHGVERHHLADIVDGVQRVWRWGDVERGAVLMAG